MFLNCRQLTNNSILVFISIPETIQKGVITRLHNSALSLPYLQKHLPALVYQPSLQIRRTVYVYSNDSFTSSENIPTHIYLDIEHIYISSAGTSVCPQIKYNLFSSIDTQQSICSNRTHSSRPNSSEKYFSLRHAETDSSGGIFFYLLQLIHVECVRVLVGTLS